MQTPHSALTQIVLPTQATKPQDETDEHFANWFCPDFSFYTQ